VVQHLVTEGPAVEHGVEEFATCALAQKADAGIDAQLASLHLLHEQQFVRGKSPQRSAAPQRALHARCVVAVCATVSEQSHSARAPKETRPLVSFCNAEEMNSYHQ